MSSNLADYIQIMTCSYDLFIKDILMWGKKKILTLKKKKTFYAQSGIPEFVLTYLIIIIRK